jgi:alpha-1,6-mannosyltransferase
LIRIVVAGAGLVAACAAIASVPSLPDAIPLFFLLFGAAFVCYAAGSWWTPSVGGPRILILVLGVALMARLALVWASPTLSTDAYRYVWDARVARAGIDPYAHSPWAKELEPLRDREVFPNLNHPTWRTVYPPGAQAFFQAVYRLRPDSVLGMKLAIGLAELIGVATVLGCLAAGGRPLSRVVVYAWNPLVLVEVWGMGHLDGLVVPAVAGAAWAAMRRRYALAGGLLGAGALVKLYPAAMLSLLPIAAWPVALVAFAVVMLAGYGPSLLAGAGVLGSLPRYVAEEYFNPGLVRSVVESPSAMLAAAGLWVLAVNIGRREEPLPARAVPLVGGLLLLSPNIFPWYAVWLTPFLAFAPSMPWTAFTGTIVLAYAFFLQQPWSVPAWARVLEFVPLALGASWWLATSIWARTGGRRIGRRAPPFLPAPDDG